MSAPRVVVVGDGPAAEAALAHLPGAIRLAPPDAAVWHAEAGRAWVEGGGRVWTEAFDALLLCADEPLLLSALGCAFADGRPLTDAGGATSVPGVFAAGAVCGARAPADAAEQGRRAAEALLAGAAALAVSAAPPPPVGARLDPAGIAALLEGPLGPERDAAILQQAALLGPVLFARPVSLAALAATAGARLPALPPQRDEDRA